jgi:TetR/AcrR family transcriptional repressor of nem operon
MARTKDYDRHDVLDKAVNVFWQKGYKACSVADIVKATGLNTASMYKEFGDKDGLFEEAIDHYRQNVLAPRLNALMNEPSIKGVEDFLKTIISGSSSKGYRGCLMMNHLSQKHSISRRAAKKLDELRETTESLLEVAFRNAQAGGDISADKDPVVLASFVMCFVHGLGLYGRYQSTKSEIPKLYEVIFQAVGE